MQSFATGCTLDRDGNVNCCGGDFNFHHFSRCRFSPHAQPATVAWEWKEALLRDHTFFGLIAASIASMMNCRRLLR